MKLRNLLSLNLAHMTYSAVHDTVATADTRSNIHTRLVRTGERDRMNEFSARFDLRVGSISLPRARTTS